MILQVPYYSAALFLVTAILGILAWYVWKRRSVPGGTYFALLMAVTAEWVLVSALEYSLAETGAKVLFAKLAFAGGISIPQLWLHFVLDYCQLGRLITRNRNLLLWALPVISIVLTLTNEYHWLIWSSIVPLHHGTAEVLIYNRGITGWIMTIYSYAIIIPAFLLLSWKILRSGENNFSRMASLLIGACIVIVLSAVSQYALIPRQGIDLTPVGLAMMGIIFAWGVFGQHIFELMPVAMEKLIENMADGVLVLNRHGTIVKTNRTARRILGVTDAIIGQPAQKALAEWPLLDRCIRNSAGATSEITTRGKEGPRWIDVSISQLQDKSARSLGTLVILRDVTEDKLIEESLRKNEYDLLKAERLANIGYYDGDLKTKEAKISEGCARIYQFPPGTDRITYEMFTGKIHPEDADRVKGDIHTYAIHGAAHALEYRIVLSDGSVRYVHSETEAVITDATGAPVRQFGIVQDVTERRLSEETLRKSEYHLIKAENMARLGYYEWDLKKNVAHISNGYAAIFGLQGKDTVTYEELTARVHPEDMAYIANRLKSLENYGLANKMEYRIVLRDGSVRHIYSESEAVAQDAAGVPIRLFGIVQDVTDRKLAEEALRLSEARHKTMVETASEGICILDEDDRLIFVNKKVADLTGFTPEEIYGHTASEFVGSENHEALRKNLAAKRLGISEQFDYRINCKDGSSVWVIASASSLYDDKGEFMATLAMLTDITDRKLADEQLKISLKEKEALLKEVHHRVKNNLQIITSLLNLQSGGIDDPKYMEMIRDSQNRIKSMALVHEQLYKSRDLSNIDISEYLHNLISNVSRSYSQASGSVALRTDLEKINMDIDKAMPVGIIVTELVSNAYKYAFPGGRKGEIQVELRREAEKFVLTISDNGVGLPEGFEIGKTVTLGLQLVEMLTQQIDGALEIESDERTRFRITLRAEKSK